VFETSTAKDGVIFYVILPGIFRFLSLLQSSITVSFSGAAAILSTDTPYSCGYRAFSRSADAALIA
jgi:hypothetical protein